MNAIDRMASPPTKPSCGIQSGTGDDALRHVVEAPGIVGHRAGLPGEIADEAPAERRGDSDLDATCLARPAQPLQQQPDADHLAAT